MIKRGKWKAVVDEDGDKVYVKKQVEQRETDAVVQQLRTKRGRAASAHYLSLSLSLCGAGRLL